MKYSPLALALLVVTFLLTGCLSDDGPITTSSSDSLNLDLSGPASAQINTPISLTASTNSSISGVSYMWKDGGDVNDESNGWVEGSASKSYSKSSAGSYTFHVMAQTESLTEKKSITVQVTEEATGDTPFARHGKLQIKNGTLVGQHGSPVQLRGMSTHGIQWFDELYTEAAIQSLAENWQADVVRLSLYAREDGYESNPSYYTSRVDELVEWATSYGLYVLIDWHQLTPGDPNADIDNAKLFFEHMASTHGNKGNVFFEICNEPNDVQTGDYLNGSGYEVTWSDHIKPYAETIIPIIRNHSSDNIIIVGTPKWASRPSDAIDDPIDDDNVMYTLHFYAADHPYNQGSEWWPSYMDNLRSAVNAGLPVFVTEFGTQDASGDGANDFDASQNWLDSLAKYNVSWVNWNFSDDGRSGAVFNEGAVSGNSSASDFANTSKMKEAGVWIMEKIKEGR